jgi:hypothetical protein
MFPNSIRLENLVQYIFMYLIFPCKISDLSNIRFENIYAISQHYLADILKPNLNLTWFISQI